MKWLVALALAVPVFLYGLYAFVIWLGCRGVLRSYRRPPKRVQREFGYSHPADFGLTAEPLAVEVATGIVLHGWIMRTDQPRRGVLVHLHGIWDSCRPRLPLAARMLPHGFDCLFYDSRGNGESGGRYCTYGEQEKHDLVRVLDAVQAQGIDTSRVVVVGHSMGAATAVYAAALDPRIKAIVLEACYRDLPTAVRDYARLFIPILPDHVIDRALERAAAIGELKPDKLSPLQIIAGISQPALIVQGTHDRRIKPRYAEELYRTKPEPKELYLIPGARHGRLPFQGGEVYMSKLEHWICEQMPAIEPLSSVDSKANAA